MRRLLWIVPSIVAVALTGFILARPSAAPADPTDSAPATVREAVPPAATELPITQVVLYSSGVGYFQRDGQVDGNTRVDLNFPVADVNDLLKSMVLHDLGGGNVSAVGYDSHDPLDKTLNSFAIQLTGNPSHAQILNQARGEKVELTLAAKPYGQVDNHGISQGILLAVHGTVMGVETKPGSGKDAGPVEMLNLWCPDGMRSIPVAEIQRVKFMNPAVENEVNRALEVLARGHDTQKKAVSLQFDGTGKRAVRVGYVVETPLWRTSYRLLVGKDGKLFVQGWAMVVNPTNEDWKDVRMALVSGRPISFKMDLYQPMYVPRPVVQPELYTSIRPTEHAQTISTGSSAQFGVAPAGTPANLVSTGVAQPVTNIGYPFNSSGPLPAHVTNTVEYKSQTSNQNQASTPTINLQNGILPAAMATDLGDTFQYAIEHAVTLPRQKSALLPIIYKALEGDKVCVYSPGAHPKYPLMALRLKNTTDMHLMQGPITVFEGSGYAGDGQLPDMRPKEERLVSYALDLGTEVETVSAEPENKLTSLRLQKGMFSVTGKSRESKTYKLKNSTKLDRVIIVEHPLRTDYKLVSKDQPKERTQDVYRFEMRLAAGEAVEREVIEEREQQIKSLPGDMPSDLFNYFLRCEFANPQMNQVLEKLQDFDQGLTKIQDDLAQMQQQLANITQDQARLRANLKEMPETAAAYKRYLEKFDSQETAIEKLQARIQEQSTLHQNRHQETLTYLESLDLESTILKAPKLPRSGLPMVTACTN